ncbi:hypothetical protein BTR23_09120 [Alkalihalophilus pseudofirmus]|nr:hypothetical protein BTR23_09120 [Alkalihalophilus pseudofirmus]
MKKLSRYKNKRLTELIVEDPNEKVSDSINENFSRVNELLNECTDFIVREFSLENNTRCFLLFIQGMADSDQLYDQALRPLLQKFFTAQDQMEKTEESISLSQLKHENNYKKVLENVLNGDTALFIDGYTDCLILNVKGADRRGIEEPPTEATIRGPREGFTENIKINTSLIRYRIKSKKLKMISFEIGEETKTKVIVAYMDGIVDPAVIDELKSRIQDIEIDGILESGYIEELIEDSTYSPFPQIHHTERPDTVAAQLLEGQFAIFTDNTPFVLTGPITFWKLMQASEDYYERYLMGNLIRWLRYLFLLVALYLPGIYVAVITYHHDMIPTNLMFSVAAAREPIPFPAIVEVLIMEITFEALREAGIRLPRIVGQAVSILGALVIGTAAVEAGIVSAPMVIIVSLTGIASFTIPKFNLAISIRMLRFPIMFFASLLGIFGIMVCTMFIALHLCKLRSFGVPYLSGFAPYNTDEQKDILIRAPRWAMTFRPSSYARRQKRMKEGMKPSPPYSKEW